MNQIYSVTPCNIRKFKHSKWKMKDHYNHYRESMILSRRSAQALAVIRDDESGFRDPSTDRGSYQK
jgi:hypothetical protein